MTTVGKRPVLSFTVIENDVRFRAARSFALIFPRRRRPQGGRDKTNEERCATLGAAHECESAAFECRNYDPVGRGGLCALDASARESQRRQVADRVGGSEAINCPRGGALKSIGAQCAAPLAL